MLLGLSMTTPRRIVVYAAAAAITLYGALLRLDAFVGKYGTLDRPAWARVMTHDVAAFARTVRPAGVLWQREAKPYVGGDPISYLKFGREMTSFYQPHVREPVFVAATRASLWALQGQDAAVSLASAAGSVLMIVATFLLGTVFAGRVAGLAAAFLVAIDYNLIVWSVDGWRDDMFSAFVILSAWALFRLRERPSFGTSLIAGIVCGLACLTRITALSFVVPALIWIAVSGDREHRRERFQFIALTAILAAAVLGPFMISCAIASGDPFLSIDQHTVYYRSAEGLSFTQPMTAGEYLRQKIAAHPIGTIDVGVTGLFVRPFVSKWNGLGVWLPWLGTVLSWCTLVGLAASVFSPKGRLLLLVIVSSLLPYAFTWNVGGGGEWRFTMHAYPLYIVAAMYAIALVPRLTDRKTLPSFARRSSAIAAIAAAASVVYVALPWFVVREAVARGESVSVEAGPRDRVFFRSGWSPPRTEGIVTVRTSREPRAVVHFPLPAKGDYDVLLRFDPVVVEGEPSAVVLYNRQLAARFALVKMPERIGSYRLTLPRAWHRAGDNELAIVPSAAAGARLWLVRILPMRRPTERP
jgi:hypothetical protein